MRKMITVLLILVSVSQVSAGWTYHFMSGGRYDNLRMCVATPAGVKGGPVGDVQLDIPLHQNGDRRVMLNFPVMRPVLFGAAFKMLQFEPEITFETVHGNRVFGPGAGISVHYGPNYQSDLKHRSPDFWAVGPFLSYLYGVNRGSQRFALRGFYTPLFSQANHPGTVCGINLEYYRGIKH